MHMLCKVHSNIQDLARFRLHSDFGEGIIHYSFTRNMVRRPRNRSTGIMDGHDAKTGRLATVTDAERRKKTAVVETMIR